MLLLISYTKSRLDLKSWTKGEKRQIIKLKERKTEETEENYTDIVIIQFLNIKNRYYKFWNTKIFLYSSIKGESSRFNLVEYPRVVRRWFPYNALELLLATTWFLLCEALRRTHMAYSTFKDQIADYKTISISVFSFLIWDML